MMKKLEVEKFDGLKTHFMWNLNKIHYTMTSEYCNFDCCRTVSLPNTFFTATFDICSEKNMLSGDSEPKLFSVDLIGRLR